MGLIQYPKFRKLAILSWREKNSGFIFYFPRFAKTVPESLSLIFITCNSDNFSPSMIIGEDCTHVASAERS